MKTTKPKTIQRCGITREQALERLRDLANDEPESGHVEADKVLLDYINDPEIEKEFRKVRKWYA